MRDGNGAEGVWIPDRVGNDANECEKIDDIDKIDESRSLVF